MEDDDPIVEEVSYQNRIQWIIYLSKRIIWTSIALLTISLFVVYFQTPVYLSKSLANNLYVIQFPIKNRNYNIDKSTVTNCCVKPMSQQVWTNVRLKVQAN